MHAKILKQNIVACTQRIQGALIERNFARIALKVDETGIHLHASDRVLAIYSSSESEVLVQGETFVPAKLFSDLVKELPPGLIEIKSEDPWLVISAGEGNRFTMKLPLVEDISWKEPPKN